MWCMNNALADAGISYRFDTPSVPCEDAKEFFDGEGMRCIIEGDVCAEDGEKIIVVYPTQPEEKIGHAVYTEKISDIFSQYSEIYLVAWID